MLGHAVGCTEALVHAHVLSVKNTWEEGGHVQVHPPRTADARTSCHLGLCCWRARVLLGGQSPGRASLPKAHSTLSALHQPRSLTVVNTTRDSK